MPGHWERALYAPPFGRALTGSGQSWERIGARLFPGIGGVHIVEVTKSLYAAAALPQEARPAGARLKAAGGDFRSS